MKIEFIVDDNLDRADYANDAKDFDFVEKELEELREINLEIYNHPDGDFIFKFGWDIYKISGDRLAASLSALNQVKHSCAKIKKAILKEKDE